MRKISLTIHIIAVCLLAGILHFGQIHHACMENVLSIQGSVSGYSEQIPWVVMDPVAGVLP
jgi:hypothetical protein